MESSSSLAYRLKTSPMPESPPSSLLALPDELLQHILCYLEPVNLAKVAQTCHRLLQQSYDDHIWQPLVNDNLPEPISRPAPLKTFRELFIAHHPYWFLTRHRIWFGDDEQMGKLLLARYEPSTGNIQAHVVTATLRRRPDDWEPWEKDPNVIVISFAPQMALDLHQPVLKLQSDSRSRVREEDDEHNHQRQRKPAFAREILMETFAEAGLHAAFMLCRALPTQAITQSTEVWPPLRFPALARTRNASSSSYTASGHHPTTLSEVSQHNFRLRKWIEYRQRRTVPSFMSMASRRMAPAALGFGGPFFAAGLSLTSMDGMHLNMPEATTTYATLPESSYMPTPEKPWQGIWCGDYSAHGAEFLVIRQPSVDEEQPLPEGMAWLQEWFRGGRRGSTDSETSFVSAREDVAGDEMDGMTLSNDLPDSPDNYVDVPNPPTGRLEAIKLTGDPNIPRGEYTFIAPDIGPAGFIRIADEEKFRGARVVRSAGHIAGTGFTEDSYTPSQLILLSHDRIAQFWEGFGHISYFQRVDLDALMKS